MSRTRIQALRVRVLQIPFKTSFRHASAERSETSSLWVEAEGEGATGYGESCPRPYVTHETLDTARAFFSRHEATLRSDVQDLDSLRGWIAAQKADIDENPAAWCAIELAILDLLAKRDGVTVEALVGIPPLSGRFQYSAVLGDAGIAAFSAMAGRFRQFGFKDFKVKLSGTLEKDREKLALLRSWGEPLRIRVDANNLWESADEAMAFLRSLDFPFFAVEEPVRPNQYAELARIAEALKCKIILDESFLRIEQIASLKQNPSHWLINLRVSKMGGLLRSLAVAAGAYAAGIGLVIGAQVGETSLLTRAALSVAMSARARGDGALVAQEGAFGTLLLERDACDPPLMFGPGGVLDTTTYPWLQSPGFGLTAWSPE